MEIKDILSLMGMETPEDGELTIDQVRDHLNNTFVTTNGLADRQDLLKPFVSSAVGKRIGSLQTALVSSAKDLGLDLNHADYKDKQIEELVHDIFGGVSEKMKNGKKPSEDFERVKGEYDELKKSVAQIMAEKETQAAEFDTERTNWKVGHVENEAWKTVQYAPTVDALKKRGFESLIKDTYKSLVDENGDVYPVFTSGENQGRRVPNPANVADKLTWDQLLKIEGTKAEVFPSVHAGKPTKPAGVTSTQTQDVPRPEGARSTRPMPAGFAGKS